MVALDHPYDSAVVVRADGSVIPSRVAVTGHSLGGAAALEAAAEDGRFQAVIDLDGLPRNTSNAPGRAPVLALVAGQGTGSVAGDRSYRKTLDAVLRSRPTTSYRLRIPDFAHLTFTDAPLYLPPVPGLVGRLNRTEGPRITAEVSGRFLDAVLRDKANGRPLEEDLARYGELMSYRPR